MAKYWVVTTSPDNFAATGERDFGVQGFKSRHRRKAEAMEPGDKLMYYLTGVKSFAATAEVSGQFFEDHDRIWTSQGKPKEDYPWRVPIRPEVIVDEEAWVPAESLLDELQWVQRWPREHWHLAFQGNLREVGEEDYRAIREALKAAQPVS